MTYASLSTIYASLTIMAAVFVSTYFPARVGHGNRQARGRDGLEIAANPSATHWPSICRSIS